MRGSGSGGQTSRIVGLAARLILSGLFIYSGGVKLLDLQTFALGISGYQLLPENLVIPLAYVLPWLELWCGVVLWLVPPFRRSAWVLITAMLLVFTAAKISALQRGLDISCGCTGSTDPMTWADVLSNLGWLLGCLPGLTRDRRG